MLLVSLWKTGNTQNTVVLSGIPTNKYGKSQFLMGKWAIFNSKLLNYQRVLHQLFSHDSVVARGAMHDNVRGNLFSSTHHWHKELCAFLILMCWGTSKAMTFPQVAWMKPASWAVVWAASLAILLQSNDNQDLFKCVELRPFLVNDPVASSFDYMLGMLERDITLIVFVDAILTMSWTQWRELQKNHFDL